MKSKIVFQYVFLLSISILQCSCHTTLILPDETRDILENEQITSYVNKDGNEIDVVPRGLRFEEASLTEDTLTIKYSANNVINKNKYYMDHKIPVSQIQSITLFRQTDKLRYGSLELGGGTGIYFGGGFTLINNTFGFNPFITVMKYRADNLPDDYNGVFTKDDIFMLSLFVSIKSPIIGKGFNYGIDLGPSIQSFYYDVFTLNPEYDPGEWWHSKYHLKEKEKNLIGLTGRLELGVCLSENVGFEIALWGNANSFKLCGGFGLALKFGRI
jgi:hypothetical protein